MSRKLVLALSMSLLAGSSGADTVEGKLGDTSTGEVDIQLDIKGDKILISGLESITLDADTSPGAGFVGSANFCVYRSGQGSKGFNFTLTPTSKNNTSGNFELYKKDVEDPKTLTENQKIAYTVDFSSNNNYGVNGIPLSNSQPSDVNANENVALTRSNTCGQDNVSILVTADMTQASQAESGTYSDTLTLLVSPK